MCMDKHQNTAKVPGPLSPHRKPQRNYCPTLVVVIQLGSKPADGTSVYETTFQIDQSSHTHVGQAAHHFRPSYTPKYSVRLRIYRNVCCEVMHLTQVQLAPLSRCGIV